MFNLKQIEYIQRVLKSCRCQGGFAGPIRGEVLKILEEAANGPVPGVQIVGWSEGRDPTEFGWTFDGNRLDADDIGRAEDWDGAIDIGIPSPVLQAFENSITAEDDPLPEEDMYGCELVTWLQDYC